MTRGHIEDKIKWLESVGIKFPPDEPKCVSHPDAPHGFNRSASHNEGRCVCDCERWVTPESDAIRAAAPELLEALITCAETFHKYAYHHRGKGDLEKADANHKLSHMCETAIDKAIGGRMK